MPNCRSGDVLSRAERTGRRGGRTVPHLRGTGRLPGLGTRRRGLSWRVGRHDTARATSDAGRMAGRERERTTGGGQPSRAGTDSEAASAGRPRRPGRFLGGHVEVPTPYGPALVEVDRPAGPARSLLVLGHGAGGGVDAPDLLAVRGAALSAGVAVARVTQPYRVRGRRTPPPVGQLDEAWTGVVSTVRNEAEHLIFGGRSSGARVACRTARALGAAGVVALAL